MRFVVVGDPHVRPSDLEDAKALMDYVRELAKEHSATILILGDLHHYHGVIRAEVLNFWHDFFLRVPRIEGRPGVIALVGNHDMTGESGSSVHSLIAHSPEDVQVIDAPRCIENILFVPYCTNDALVEAANKYSYCPTVICHATFNGASYENGFYAKDGLDPERLPQSAVISGHIHAPQVFGKVFYPGAPRALTVSDANLERSIWLVDVNTAGEITAKISFPLTKICRQIYHLEDTLDKPVDVVFDPRHRYVVDIKGPVDWIAQRKPIFEGVAQVRTFRTDTAAPKLKESDGIDVAFRKYLDMYRPANGTKKEILQDMLKERGFNV